MHDFDKKKQNKPRTLDYSGIIHWFLDWATPREEFYANFKLYNSTSFSFQTLK